MEQVVVLLKQYGALICIGLLGLGMLVYGLWGQLVPERATVEIIKGSENQTSKAELVIDVAGSVEKPGVYSLPGGSRIGDAVVAAGGFSVLADRAWVTQTLNLASELKDGQKVYIPSVEEEKTPPLAGKININTASLSELDSLAGIGVVRAQAIIDSRPYGDVLELVTRAKVPQSVYEKIKDQVSVH